jgi:hypothetical protein
MTENRLTIWTCSLAAAAGLDHLPDFSDDDTDQQQDGRRIDQKERNDNFGCRLDSSKAGEHHESEEGR